MSLAEAYIKRCIAEAKRLEAELAEEEADRLETQERERAFREAWGLYAGLPTTRSKALAKDYASYLSNAWPREQELRRLPDSSSAKRRALHRFARSREGKSLSMRAIFDIAKKDAADGFATASAPVRIRINAANRSNSRGDY